MKSLGCLILLHVLSTAALAAGPDLTLNALGTLEKRSGSGKRQWETFADMLTDFESQIAACIGGYKPKASGTIAQADAKAFQECLKRNFNENIQEPLMRKLYPNEQLSTCK
jgi:hypothetical protein